MTVLDLHPHVVSVTEAAKSGLPRLLRDVEAGEDVVVERHGKPVAAVVSMRHLEEIRCVEVDLRETVLLLSRAATDGGRRTGLAEVLTAFGFDRAELEAESTLSSRPGEGDRPLPTARPQTRTRRRTGHSAGSGVWLASRR